MADMKYQNHNYGGTGLISNDSLSKSEMQLQNYEKILNALKKEGKDIGDLVTKDEISFFLDKNTRNGNFNPALKDKIFKALFTDEITEIPVSDFVNNFSALASELRKALIQYEKKNKENNEIIENYKSEINNYKNEKIIDDISEYATFRITFMNVEFKSCNENDNKQYNLGIGFYSKDEEQMNFNSTSFFSINSSVINEDFDFQPNSKENYLIVQLYEFNDIQDNNPQELGQIQLNLNTIDNQNEFDIDLLIPDINNPGENTLIVKAKAYFIWNYTKYYTDLLKDREEMKTKIDGILNKTKNFYESLYNLEFFADLKESYKLDDDIYKQPSNNNNVKNTNFNSNSNNISSNKNFRSTQQLANNVDNYISNKFNGQKLNWYKVTLIFIIIFAVLNFIITLTKNDYINNLLAGICLICILNKDIKQSKIFQYNSIIFMFIFTYVFDILWLFICGGNYLYGSVSTISKKLSFFITIINMIIKAIIFIGFICINSKNNNK